MAVVKYEEVTVNASSAKSLDVPGDARKIVLQPSVDIRVRSDGTAPTSSVGTRIPVDAVCYLDEGEARTAQFRSESDSGVLRVHYYS